MQAISLTIANRGSQSLAPASGTDLVRLMELQAGLSGCAPRLHVHTSADVTDLGPAVLALLSANGVPLSGTGSVSLQPAGGLKYTGSLLGVDSGTVSLVGHQHPAADIVDLASAVTSLLAASLGSSDSIVVSGTGPVALNVKPAPGGALALSADGLAVDLGTSHSQAAYGDHTHALLHSPVTFGAMSSLSGTQSGQQLSLEMIPVLGGGLLVTPSGVAVDFAVVQRAGAGTSGTSLTVVNTTTLQFGYAGGVLSGTVPLDGSPPGGTGGRIITGVNGLRVVLGTDNQSAAAGDHGHDPASSVVDGFLSATDKVRLDALWSAGPLSGVQTYDTDTLHLIVSGNAISGSVLYDAAPPAGVGRGALGETANGLHVVLGTAGNQAASGDHLHDDRYPVIASGTLVLYPGVTSAPVNLSGVAAWFKVVAGGSEYRIPLYQ